MTLPLERATVFLLGAAMIAVFGAQAAAAAETAPDYGLSYPSWRPTLLGAQFTLVGQSLPPFPSTYSGPNSLTGKGDGAMSQTYGIYFGSRPDDRLGIGFAVNFLSDDHREYLAAGGTGFVLGDGRLNYGTERIFETYYRFQVFRYAQMGPDFQYIANPGYNRDRGPAFVLGRRLRVA